VTTTFEYWAVLLKIQHRRDINVDLYETTPNTRSRCHFVHSKFYSIRFMFVVIVGLTFSRHDAEFN